MGGSTVLHNHNISLPGDPQRTVMIMFVVYYDSTVYIALQLRCLDM